MQKPKWRKNGVENYKGKILVKTQFGVIIGYYRPKKVVCGAIMGEGVDTIKGSYYCPVREWMPLTAIVPEGLDIIDLTYVDYTGVKLTNKQLK